MTRGAFLLGFASLAALADSPVPIPTASSSPLSVMGQMKNAVQQAVGTAQKVNPAAKAAAGAEAMARGVNVILGNQPLGGNPDSVAGTGLAPGANSNSNSVSINGLALPDNPAPPVRNGTIESPNTNKTDSSPPSQWGAAPAFVNRLGDKPEELAAKIRDPFMRPRLLEEQAIPRTELESIPIEQFKVVGVITGPNKRRAMVSANGKTYFISQNVKIGTKSGVVLEILSDGVVVREKTINLLGREENQDIQLKVEPEKQGRGGG